MMQRRLLSTGYVSAELELPGDVLEATWAGSVSDSLPGGWTLEGLPGSGSGLPEIIARIDDHDHALVTLESASVDRYHIRLPGQDLRSVRIAYLTYTVLERQRQLSGMATIHASGARSPQGEGILILGDKGSGKTSTMLALGDRGYALAGDDIVVLRRRLHGLELLPGTRSSAVRGPPRHGALYYETKRRVALSETYPVLHSPVALAKVFRVNVNVAARETKLQRVVSLSFAERLRLHENIGRYISGLPTPLVVDADGCYGRVLEIDCATCAATRRDLMKALGATPFYYLQTRCAVEAAAAIASEMER